MVPVNIVHIVINQHGAIFAELIDLLKDALEQLGIEVALSRNRLLPGVLNLLVGHTCFLNQATYDQIQRSGNAYIVFQLESLSASEGYLKRFPAYAGFLRGAAQVWDYARSNFPLLAQLGCANLAYIAVGYSPRLERIVHPPEADIDVLFYGALNARRRAALSTIQRRGLRVQALFNAYGPPRDQMIARSKIVLNIHQFPTRQLEQLRIAYLLNNRCFVISEASDQNPYGEGVVFCGYDQLAETCASYASPGRESERRQIAGRGYAMLKAISTPDMIRQALQQLAPQ